MSLLMVLLIVHLGWEGLKLIRERCWKDLIVLILFTALGLLAGLLYILGFDPDLYKLLRH
ncbi:MAG TPA: hypothetical protein VEC37_17250 [Bacillota bacterium]|nr:hypothetical protein [Bacillota bacterium]